MVDASQRVFGRSRGITPQAYRSFCSGRSPHDINRSALLTNARFEIPVVQA